MPSNGEVKRGEAPPNETEGKDEVPQLPKKPAALTASNKNSFAYPTLKDRVPVIICKIIDILHRQRLQLNLKDAEALKRVLELMAKLRYELQTNKPFVKVNDNRKDVDVWNGYLERRTVEEGATPRWFDTSWLYAECYTYRRLIECMAQSTELRDFDFFFTQKADSFSDNLAAVDALAMTLEAVLFRKHGDVTNADILRKDFRNMLEICLWGNKCDLSLSAMEKQDASTFVGVNMETLRRQLLVDDWHKVWDCLMYARISVSGSQSNSSGVGISSRDIAVDIVMDNAGYEMFTDLCLADFLVTSGLATLVRFRVKTNPWFVSDVTKQDLDHLLLEMSGGAKKLRKRSSFGSKHRNLDNSLEPEDREKASRLERLGEKWKGYVSLGSWSIHSDEFWTYPHDYSLMRTEDQELYSSLSEASLVIFKGDLNYRKLVGDLNWDPTAPFELSLQGFHPAPLVSLRILKADVVTGLSSAQVEKVKELDEEWMTDGQWGVIQFCETKDVSPVLA